jgi:hypothetical protein
VKGECFMPFIEPERRPIIDEKGLWALDEVQPGDRCYFFYKRMVDKCKANLRWTTAHEIYKQMKVEFKTSYYLEDGDKDNRAAYELAWQVFFQLYVMPYELKKREENGEI